MYNTLLFDFDGTVFDTLEGITKSAGYALSKHGFEVPLEQLRCFAGPPVVETFKRQFNFDDELAMELGNDFWERYIPIGIYESHPFPGVVEMLNQLRAEKKTIAITTMKPLYMAEAILDRAGLKELFHGVYGSPPTGKESPKEEIIAAAMKDLNASLKDTILIGDTKYDIIGAHQVGIPALGVRYGYGAAGELEQAKADMIVDTLEELKAFLLSH